MKPALLARADAYQAQALSPATKRMYDRALKYFDDFCSTAGVPPHLSLSIVEACLGKRVTEVGPDAVATVLQALRHAARRRGNDRLLYDDRIEAIIRGARREHQKGRRERFASEQLLAVSNALGNEPLDIRDRALAIFVYAAMPTQIDLQQLKRPDLLLTSTELTVRFQRHNREVSFSRGKCAEICPVRSMAAWLNVRGPDPKGYVFVGRGSRGDYNRTPVNHFLVNSALHRATYIAGFGPRPLSLQTLRAGGIRVAKRSLSSVPLAYVLGFRRPSSLERYGPTSVAARVSKVRADHRRGGRRR